MPVEAKLQTLIEKLDSVSVKQLSLVCVGLDPRPELMPVDDVARFNCAIIDATKDLVAAYKPQMAFYEALGIEGLRALEATVQHIRDVAPEVVIIGDGKRGDIGPTAAAYARAMFEYWDFDATTVYSYQGSDSVEPFLQYPDRGVYIVCRSSNPSSRDFQDLRIEGDPNKARLFEKVAEAAERWGGGENVGIVVGGTYPEELAQLRLDHPNMPFLIPGVGAQGGDAAQSARAAVNADGRGVVISSSRAILYGSDDPERYPMLARLATQSMRNEINAAIA